MCDLSSSDWAAVEAIGTIFAVLAAIWISQREAKLTRKRDENARADRQMDCWAAIRAEVEVCGRMATEITDVHDTAPSYRLPTIAYNKILHELLLVARLNAADVRDLLLFFTDVEAVNRGFDIAQELKNHGNQRDFDVQTSLAFDRAGLHVRPACDHYEAAMAVIKRHVADDK